MAERCAVSLLRGMVRGWCPMVRDAPAMCAGNGPRATDYARGARLNMRGQGCAMRGGAAPIQIQSQTPAMRGAITLVYYRHKKAGI